MKYSEMEKKITLKKTKMETPYPSYCIQISQEDFKEINSSPETYTEFIEELKKDIFPVDELSNEDEIDFISKIDFDLTFVSRGKKSSPFVREILGKHIHVVVDGDDILIIVGIVKEVSVPCMLYYIGKQNTENDQQ